MHINVVLITFVILLGLLMSNNDNSKNRKNYIILCSIVLILVAALRNPEWMTGRYNIDSLVYKNYFETYSNLSWSECWTMAFNRYFGSKSESDIGFIFFNKIIGCFTHSFYIYSIIADLIFFVPFGVILYRYTYNLRQLIFAFVFYIGLVQIFFIGGGRQMFALGFDLMALLAMLDKKKLRFFVLFIVGVTIHFSSFLFILPLLLIRFNPSAKTLKLAHILGFLLVPLVLAFPNQVVNLLGEASGLEKYSKYASGEIQGGATAFILLIEGLSLFCLFAIRQLDLIKNSTFRLFYIMTPWFTLLAPLIRSNGTMIRISLYFHLFLVLLVPYALECFFNDRSKNIAYIVAIVGMAFFTLHDGGLEYYFFWQK